MATMAGDQGDMSRKAATHRWRGSMPGLMWLCPLSSLVFAAWLFWMFGLDPWTAAIAGLLLGCPVAVAWTLFEARRKRRQLSDNEVP